MASWSSRPSSLFLYGQAMIAALFINTSIFSMLVSSRIICAADRTELKEERSTGMKAVRIEGLMDVIVSIVGWILESERPRRMIVEGEA